jgi:hypothetical protein
MWENMWANTCWGLFGLAVALGLAMIGLLPEYAWLRPWFAIVAILSFVASLICFLWPIISFRRRAKSVAPDMKISDAIDYIVNDSIAILKNERQPIPLGSYPPGTAITISGVEHQDARSQLNSKLNTGEIKSWGIRSINTHIPNQFEHSLREIPIDYWSDMQLDYQSCLFYKVPYAQTMAIPGKRASYDFADITVSKRQIEELWPKKSILRRLIAKITMRPRIRPAYTLNGH